MTLRRVKFRSYDATIAVFMVAIVIQAAHSSQTKQTSAQESGPKDYPYSPLNSRVKELVSFFEIVDRSSVDRELSQRQNVVLSLPESASKLRLLAGGLSLDTKCNKYSKLLSRPNIRNVATISELMKESKLFRETIQEDANLESRLSDARLFDALGRIETILQTLKAESTLGKSNLEPAVEKDLLDCVTYYIYRHQRATHGVIEHVRAALESIPKSAVQSSATELLLRKFHEPIERIDQIESFPGGISPNISDWLEQLTIIQNLAAEHDYEIPEFVRSYLNEPTRLARLESLETAPRECYELMNKIAEIEQSEPESYRSDEEYRSTLARLNSLVDEYGAVLTEDVKEFLSDINEQDVTTSMIVESQPVIAQNLSQSQLSDKSGHQLERSDEVERAIGATQEIRSDLSEHEDCQGVGRDEKIDSVERVSPSEDDNLDEDDNGLVQSCANLLEARNAALIDGDQTQKELNITLNIEATLDKFNTDCTSSSYLTWISNRLLSEGLKERGYRPFRARILDTLTDICFKKSQLSQATLSPQECDRVERAFELMRKRQERLEKRVSLREARYTRGKNRN